MLKEKVFYSVQQGLKTCKVYYKGRKRLHALATNVWLKKKRMTVAVVMQWVGTALPKEAWKKMSEK